MIYSNVIVIWLFYFPLIAFRPLVSDRYDSPKPASSKIFSPSRETGTPLNDEPLSNARRRAERVITEDSFFDSRGARVPKNTIGEAIREFDDEVCNACNYIFIFGRSENNFFFIKKKRRSLRQIMMSNFFLFW